MERAGEKSRPHILLADDHAIFSEALRVLLEKTYAVVGIVADGRALVSEAMRLKPDVVVVDVGMPLLNGLDAAQRMQRASSKRQTCFLDHAGRPESSGGSP